MVVIVAACVLFAITGSASAATPTNCTVSGCGFGGKCVNNAAGTASTCVCYEGFEVSLQTFECIDINECNETSAALCPNGYCYNIYGDYKCNCFPGFLPHYPDGKTCVRHYDECRVSTRCPDGWCINHDVSYEKRRTGKGVHHVTRYNIRHIRVHHKPDMEEGKKYPLFNHHRPHETSGGFYRWEVPDWLV